MQIRKHTVVALRYTMKDQKGEIIDDIMAQAPLEYVHGTGDIMASLESSVEGLSEGAHTSFLVFDPVLDQPLQLEVVIDKIRSATEEEIEKKRVIKPACGPDCDC